MGQTGEKQAGRQREVYESAQTTITYYILLSLNNRKSPLMVLEAVKSEIKVPATLMSGNNSLPVDR